MIGGVVAGLNHAMHAGDDNGYDREGRKVDNRGGDTINYMYDDNGNIISSTPVQNSYSQFPSGGSIRGYGHKWNPISPALKDPSFDIVSTLAGWGASLKGVGIGAKYLNKITGGAKQWIRTGSSYSVKGGFKTYSTRWGAGGKHWQKIGNSTLQNWNKSLRQTKLPGNNWRVQDPDHFHWKKINTK